MKVTRRNVFETNSSSTHSITIAGGDYEPQGLDVSPEHGSAVRIHPGEFGWEQATYRDAATKASYALTFAKQTEDDAALELLRRVIAAETAAVVVFVQTGDEHHPWGYIDHQSCESYDGEVEGAAVEVFKSRDALRDFIFNPQSVLVTDNDNH